MKWLKILVVFIFSNVLVKAQHLPTGLKWSLLDCLEYAVENNISIKKATLDKETANLNAQQAKNNRLPSLAANGNGNISFGYTIDPITSDFVNKTITSNSYSLNSQIAIYQGNRINLEIQKNKFLTEQAALYQKQSENNITLSVLEQYLQALYYSEGITIAKNNLQSSEAELLFTKTKFENGAVAKKELADMETQHAQNQYNLTNSQSLYAQQVMRLKQLLELPPAYEFTIAENSLPELNGTIPDKVTVFNEAVALLPDVKIFDLQNNILSKELKISKAAARPTLSLGAGLNSGYTNTMMNYDYFSQLHRNFSQQASITLSVPIFSKFQNRTNTQQTRINIKQNELDKISASKTLYASIEMAWLNAHTNRAQQQSAKVAKENAALAYELASKKYEFGGLTTTELAVSRTTFLNNEQTYLQSKYMSILYLQLLNYYQGKPFDILKSN